MPYYNICPYCDNHLDPGEKCDCNKEKAQELFCRHLKMEPIAGQLAFVFDNNNREDKHEKKMCI